MFAIVFIELNDVTNTLFNLFIIYDRECIL